MNSRVFQRLRGIKQLAMTYLVYPSALHTRFEHSIGAYHLCVRYLESLTRIPEFNSACSPIEETIKTALMLTPDEDGKEGTFALTIVPPAAPANARQPRDVVFVLDRSCRVRRVIDNSLDPYDVEDLAHSGPTVLRRAMVTFRRTGV